MAPRSNWKGYLKLSLVSCPVALYSAASENEKVSFHMLNGATGHRLKQQYVNAETGEVVERDGRVKGYEIEKDDYVVLTEEELDAVEIESSHTIDIRSFSPRAEVDPVYYDNHYYISPDDKVGAEAFAVIREAMRKRDVVGIARVVLYGRERSVMVEPREAGLLATTMRHAYEVRDDKAYFADIPNIEIGQEMLDLALHIIDGKAETFDPAAFADAYQDAVVELIRARRAGRPPPAPRAAAPGNVVDLMDALRRSLGSDRAPGKPPAKKTAAKTAPARKGKAAAARARVRKAG